MQKREEKVLAMLRSDEDNFSVEDGDYITVFKRIGNAKSVVKTLNIKPDFVATERDEGVCYVFICNNVFDVFRTLSKFVLFKKIGVPFDFKKLYFFVESGEELFINEEFGYVRTEEKYNTFNEADKINEMIKEYEERIQKRVIVKFLEED